MKMKTNIQETNEAEIESSTAAETSTEEVATEADPYAALDFDAFAPENIKDSATDEQTAAEPEAVKAEGETELQPADGTVEGEPATAPNVVENQNAPDYLQQALDAKDALISSLSSTKEAEGEGQPETDPTPEYGFNLPPELLQGLRSEDGNEFQAALQGTLQGLARMVHKTIIEEMSGKFDTLQNESMPSLMQKHLSEMQMQQTVAKDFYGTYPYLDRDELRPLVQQVTEQLLQSGKYTEYNQALKEAVAAKMGELGVKGSTTSVQGEPAKIATHPKMSVGGGSRPSSPTGIQKELNDLMT